MDFLNKRFIAAVNRLRDEVEHLRKSIDSIRNDYKADSQSSRNRPLPSVVIKSELQVPETTERNRNRRDDRSHRQQIWLTVGTWLAFIAASIYAAIAACQLKQMRIATEAAAGAANVAAMQFEFAERPKVSGDIRFTRPLVIDRDGLHLDVAMILNNTGATIAVGTNIQYEFYAFQNVDGPMPDFVRDRVCKLAKSESLKWWLNPNRPSFPDVYPGKPAEFGLGVKINRQVVDQNARDTGQIMPVLVICVAYHPVFNHTITYDTGFAYDISHPNRKLIETQDGTIPIDQLDFAKKDITQR